MFSNIFNLLLFTFSCQCGTEEKASEQNKKNYYLQQNKEPKLSPPSHRPEALDVEIPHCNYRFFHSCLFKYFCTKIEQTSEKYQARLDIFLSECSIFSRFTSKVEQTSEKYQACLDIFLSECKFQISLADIIIFFKKIGACTEKIYICIA